VTVTVIWRTFLAWVWAIWLGCLALIVVAFAVEVPVLRWMAPFLGPSWIPTAHLGFECAAMAAAGFVAGRFNRSHPMWTAGLLAATFCVTDFRGAIAVNVPWLIRLAWNSFHDSRYLDSLVTSLGTHVLLFGCLIAGAMLSRPREKAISIVD
jgi:hypothetical protein